VALPGAAPDPVGEVGHLVEHGVNLGNYILPVNDNCCSARRAQGHVQDGSVLRDVDLLATKHGVDPRTQAGFLRQLKEELEGLIGDAILRVIEEDAHSLGGQACAAFGIIREEFPEVQFPHLLMVGFEGLPCWTCRE
jgi:hypothetical protein